MCALFALCTGVRIVDSVHCCARADIMRVLFVLFRHDDWHRAVLVWRNT